MHLVIGYPNLSMKVKGLGWSDQLGSTSPIRHHDDIINAKLGIFQPAGSGRCSLPVTCVLHLVTSLESSPHLLTCEWNY